MKKIVLVLFMLSLSFSLKAEEKNRGYIYIREGLKLQDLIVKKNSDQSKSKAKQRVKQKAKRIVKPKAKLKAKQEASAVVKKKRQEKIRFEKKALKSRRNIVRTIRKEESLERKEDNRLEFLKTKYGEEMGPVMLQGEKIREAAWQEAEKEIQKARAIAR